LPVLWPATRETFSAEPLAARDAFPAEPPAGREARFAEPVGRREVLFPDPLAGREVPFAEPVAGREVFFAEPLLAARERAGALALDVCFEEPPDAPFEPRAELPPDAPFEPGAELPPDPPLDPLLVVCRPRVVPRLVDDPPADFEDERPFDRARPVLPRSLSTAMSTSLFELGIPHLCRR
jgi:hypothetical protein